MVAWPLALLQMLLGRHKLANVLGRRIRPSPAHSQVGAVGRVALVGCLALDKNPATLQLATLRLAVVVALHVVVAPPNTGPVQEAVAAAVGVALQRELLMRVASRQDSADELLEAAVLLLQGALTQATRPGDSVEEQLAVVQLRVAVALALCCRDSAAEQHLAVVVQAVASQLTLAQSSQSSAEQLAAVVQTVAVVQMVAVVQVEVEALRQGVVAPNRRDIDVVEVALLCKSEPANPYC